MPVGVVPLLGVIFFRYFVGVGAEPEVHEHVGPSRVGGSTEAVLDAENLEVEPEPRNV